MNRHQEKYQEFTGLSLEEMAEAMNKMFVDFMADVNKVLSDQNKRAAARSRRTSTDLSLLFRAWRKKTVEELKKVRKRSKK